MWSTVSGQQAECYCKKYSKWIKNGCFYAQESQVTVWNTFQNSTSRPRPLPTTTRMYPTTTLAATVIKNATTADTAVKQLYSSASESLHPSFLFRRRKQKIPNESFEPWINIPAKKQRNLLDNRVSSKSKTFLTKIPQQKLHSGMRKEIKQRSD